MASVYVVSILLLSILQHHQSKPIRLGSSLSPSGQPRSWNSPSGLFQFGFYKQGTGFSVGISLVSNSDITIVWTAIRDHPPVSSNATLTLTMNGKLILITEEGQLTLIPDSDDSIKKLASFASMLDSGNFVLYNDSSAVIWSSFSNPTDTILGGQNLHTEDEIVSSVSETNKSSGNFILDMQSDGNLVSYPKTAVKQDTEAYWVSKTYGRTYTELNLSPAGVLQMLDDSERPHIIANSSKSVKSMNETVIYRATLDPDGILRLYSHRFDITGNSTVTIEWSALPNQCYVKGFCGLNSFCCTNNSITKPTCYCFPGFKFINPDKKFLGCYRNLSDEEGCKRKKPEEFYNISDMQITELGGLAYAELPMNKKDCSKSCLADCYCGAAVHSNGTCSKFKLPIISAVKDQNQSTVLLIKSSSGKVLRIPPTASLVKERVVTDNKKMLITVVTACLGSITLLCFLIAIYSFLVYKLRVNRYERLRENANLGPAQEFYLQSFSYTDLEQATNGFQEELGRGYFGAVYKGAISEGKKIVAVKRLENPVEEGERKFQAEMAAVRRTHHRNLVPLLGFCMQSSKKLLVYEFMSKGSLADLLFDVEKRPLWKDRVRIALTVARGILYLHEECEVQIIHCDIKLRNILVDDSWNAKISDFGLAKILMPNQTGIVAQVRGSRGYMAPEWQSSGLITVKSDVYSFGVVLLEIVCCRSNFKANVSSADEVLLSSWVYNCFVARELNQLIGEEGVDMKTVERMVKVGLLCIQNDPSLRPSIKNVILMLEGTKDIPVPSFPNPLVST